MSGNKILLDTNAFIYFFEGQRKITSLVVNTPEIYFSAISEIELLSANSLNQSEIDTIKTFLSLCHRVDLISDVIEQTIKIRRQYRFRMPDAIIAASARYLNIPLVSADTHFQKFAELDLISDILE